MGGQIAVAWQKGLITRPRDDEDKYLSVIAASKLVEFSISWSHSVTKVPRRASMPDTSLDAIELHRTRKDYSAS